MGSTHSLGHYPDHALNYHDCSIIINTILVSFISFLFQTSCTVLFKMEKAREVYKVALYHHPNENKIILPYVNTLQVSTVCISF